MKYIKVVVEDDSAQNIFYMRKNQIFSVMPEKDAYAAEFVSAKLKAPIPVTVYNDSSGYRIVYKMSEDGVLLTGMGSTEEEACEWLERGIIGYASALGSLPELGVSDAIEKITLDLLIR